MLLHNILKRAKSGDEIVNTELYIGFILDSDSPDEAISPRECCSNKWINLSLKKRKDTDMVKKFNKREKQLCLFGTE